MAKVSFLGLGVMGYPMAGHLRKKGGHEVTVYNRTSAKAEAWAKEYGGRHAPTPKAAAAGQDRLRVVETGFGPAAASGEQWDDAGNLLVLAPGLVVSHERNVATPGWSGSVSM